MKNVILGLIIGITLFSISSSKIYKIDSEGDVKVIFGFKGEVCKY